MASDRETQIARQWRLLQKLAANRRGWTLLELHRYLVDAGYECVDRTVRRDLEHLERGGFSLTKEGSRWCFLESGLGLKKTLRMTEVEMISMLIAQENIAGASVAGPLGDFFGQVRAMLGPQQRDFVDALKRRIHASPHATVMLDPQAEQLRSLTRAINGQWVASIRYWSPHSGESERKIEPYLLWHAHGGLYVVAHDHRSSQIRTFAVQRIAKVVVLEDRFTPDPSFNPSEHTRRGFGVFNGEKHRIRIEFGAGIAHLLTERQWHHTQQIEQIEAGVRVTWHMAGLLEVARWVAGFGGDARVLEPGSLVEMVQEIHRTGLAG